MRTVHCWWDQSWATLWARRVRLETDGQHWWVRVTVGSERGEDVYGPATETQARGEMARVLDEMQAKQPAEWVDTARAS